MKKIVLLTLLSAMLYSPVFSMGTPPEKQEIPAQPKTDIITKASEKYEATKILSGKTILMIVPSKDFNDTEYLIPRRMFESNGANIIVASSKLDPAIGVKNTKVTPDILLKNVKVKNYNAVIFIGGPGASEYYDNQAAHAIATWGYALSKPIGAICLAPIILAKSGLLGGKKATGLKEKADILTEEGAIYTGSDVEVFGHLITADSPASAEKFAKAFINALNKQK